MLDAFAVILTSSLTRPDGNCGNDLFEKGKLSTYPGLTSRGKNWSGLAAKRSKGVEGHLLLKGINGRGNYHDGASQRRR
jgi:hypothetical protein